MLRTLILARAGAKAHRWRVLPGAPGAAGILANENLFVSTTQGQLDISPQGEVLDYSLPPEAGS